MLSLVAVGVGMIVATTSVRLSVPVPPVCLTQEIADDAVKTTQAIAIRLAAEGAAQEELETAQRIAAEQAQKQIEEDMMAAAENNASKEASEQIAKDAVKKAQKEAMEDAAKQLQGEAMKRIKSQIQESLEEKMGPFFENEAKGDLKQSMFKTTEDFNEAVKKEAQQKLEAYAENMAKDVTKNAVKDTRESMAKQFGQQADEAFQTSLKSASESSGKMLEQIAKLGDDVENDAVKQLKEALANGLEDGGLKDVLGKLDDGAMAQLGEIGDEAFQDSLKTLKNDVTAASSKELAKAGADNILNGIDKEAAMRAKWSIFYAARDAALNTAKMAWHEATTLKNIVKDPIVATGEALGRMVKGPALRDMLGKMGDEEAGNIMKLGERSAQDSLKALEKMSDDEFTAAIHAAEAVVTVPHIRQEVWR